VESLWFSPGTPVSSINKTDCHDIAEILVKVALNTITITPNPQLFFCAIYNKTKYNNNLLKNNQKWCRGR
jgi:hypothetical protein